MKIKYKVFVKTLQGKSLTFRIEEYEIIDGDFIRFTDLHTDKIKIFHTSNCEIEEVEYG